MSLYRLAPRTIWIKSQIDAKGLIRALDHAIERHKLFHEMQRGYEERIASLSG